MNILNVTTAIYRCPPWPRLPLLYNMLSVNAPHPLVEHALRERSALLEDLAARSQGLQEVDEVPRGLVGVRGAMAGTPRGAGRRLPRDVI